MRGIVTRRDLMKLLGGSALGFVLTPVPWKLTDDLAIWTQNWSRIPRLPRGEIATKHTVCSICPVGCGVRARCAGGRPFSLAGVPRHPVSGGSLCPVGLAGHHLPFHPARLTGPVKRIVEGGSVRHEATRLPEALAALRAAVTRAESSGAGRVAILDARPGRALSCLYRSFLASLRTGLYVTASSIESRSLAVLEEMAHVPRGTLGYDLGGTRVILSFGAPILEGWLTTGGTGRAAPGEPADGARLRILQVEARPSLTARRADRWLQIRPGSEAAFALGLAHVLIREGLHDEAWLRRLATDFTIGGSGGYAALAASFPPDRAARITGLSGETIVATAREIAGGDPFIAVGGGDAGGGPLGREEEIAIQGLNLLMGRLGRPGGIVSVAELPVPEGLAAGEAPRAELAEVEDHSVAVLIVDASASDCALPWSLVQRKLARSGAEIVSLSPHLTGLAMHADYVVPAPSFPESWEEIPTLPGRATASFTVAAPLLPAPPGATDPALLISALATGLGMSASKRTGVDLMRERAALLHASGRGQLFIFGNARVATLREIGDPARFWQLLEKGALWTDEPRVESAVTSVDLLGGSPGGFARLLARAEGRTEAGGDGYRYPMTLMPFGPRVISGDGALPPVVAKLYAESGLRDGPGTCWMSPATAGSLGLREGGFAEVETRDGRARLRVRFDPRVMAGLLHVLVAPDPDRLGRGGEGAGDRLLALVPAGPDGTWRAASARVREA